MTELLHQMRDPAQTNLGGGSVGSIPSSFIAPTNNPGFRPSNATSNVSAIGIVAGGGGNQRVSHHSTPASNLKFAEAARTAQHDGSPSVVSRSGSTTASASLVGGRLAGSKSYTSGLNHSAGTVQVNTSSHSQRHSHAAMAPPSSTAAAAQPTPATLLDISPNNTQFFEVMYVGKIKVSHKRVPFSFIDDALPKFKAYDAQKIKTAAAASRRVSLAMFSQCFGRLLRLLCSINRIPTSAARAAMRTHPLPERQRQLSRRRRMQRRHRKRLHNRPLTMCPSRLHRAPPNLKDGRSRNRSSNSRKKSSTHACRRRTRRTVCRKSRNCCCAVKAKRCCRCNSSEF